MDLSLQGTSGKIQKTLEGEEFDSEEQDRIISLPDAVLCHVLSFLPTKSAAQTGILSKRWKDLWVSMPVLDIEMNVAANFKGDWSTFQDVAKSQKEKFKSFLDKFFAVRGNTRTRKFRIESDQVDPESISNWMSSIHGVEELDLRLFFPNNDLYPWKFDGSWLSSNLSVLGKSLRVLKITGNISINILSTLSFSSLEILHLVSVEYVDDLSIRKLLSSCPVLEDLTIRRDYLWDNVQNFVISVPSVKRLDLDFQIDEEILYDPEEGKDTGCSLFVDAPKAEYLRLFDQMSSSIIVNPMPHVTESHVVVCKGFEGSRSVRAYGNNVCALFSSISNVECLKIGCSTMEALEENLIKRLPKFHNLIRLEVYNDGLNVVIPLPTLLELAPKLETLILPQGIIYSTGEGFISEENHLGVYLWKPPQTVPDCLLHTLKVVEIHRISGRVEELKLIKYFIENAMVLERMTILCKEWIVLGEKKKKTPAAGELDDRFPFRHDLMNHIRGSSTCTLDIQIPEPRLST